MGSYLFLQETKVSGNCPEFLVAVYSTITKSITDGAFDAGGLEKSNLLAYILSTFDLDQLGGIITARHLVIGTETLS